jgi:RHS repeat-associated protein
MTEGRTVTKRGYETGLDYFGARYFSSAQGRWTSPERLNVTEDRLLNPSSTLNEYVYGANNPLRFVDPDGRGVVALLGERFLKSTGRVALHGVLRCVTLLRVESGSACIVAR